MINGIDMRQFAQSVGTNLAFKSGSIIFNKGDSGTCMYVVQAGTVEMVLGDKVIEVCGPNEAIGFMSIVDQAPRARPRGLCAIGDRRPEVSVHGR